MEGASHVGWSKQRGQRRAPSCATAPLPALAHLVDRLGTGGVERHQCVPALVVRSQLARLLALQVSGRLGGKVGG